MRIFATTPLHVGVEELARRQQRYDAISPAGVTVELHDLAHGAPEQLDNAEDIARSDDYVHRALAAAPAGYDVLMADCVLDPAVARLQEETDRPVVGILKLNLALAAALAAPMGAVVRNEAIAAEMRRVAAAYGWERWLGQIEILDLPFDSISDGPGWQQRLDEAAEVLAAKGARTLLNGCSAVDVDPEHPSAVPVFDPVLRALELVAAGAGR
ncbi:aspartate/glutamate racemase family protein [Amycolatopsis rhabdoformis]|uniref:Aspartate/glutamate racemase family protein n=1 Tax=Amycolatopsis rhabdoformis TaxID=1448059 RepID=A0ABZ1IHY8_9PSEU|nr:aspartate/glutamate racemase family protein [Amycolatopsis rhabdoformis]WSE33862.1 aspartate/glutamate racemase family protein [Amycolatopsis rhabdoformis]